MLLSNGCWLTRKLSSQAMLKDKFLVQTVALSENEQYPDVHVAELMREAQAHACRHSGRLAMSRHARWHQQDALEVELLGRHPRQGCVPEVWRIAERAEHADATRARHGTEPRDRRS